jgi:Viral BACON domain
MNTAINRRTAACWLARTFARLTARTSMAGLLLLAAACGGGGGGGGGSSVPTGAFTLGGTSANFTALQGGQTPPAQSFNITLTGSGTAYVGAAYTGGQTQPGWLGINITGSGTQFQLVVNVNALAASPGQYSSTFEVGTADANGNILAHQDFTVSFTDSAHIVATTTAGTQSLIYGDTLTTQPVPITVTAPSRQWTASSDSAWLHIATSAQSNSESINATVDETGLQPGTYSGTIQLVSNLEGDDTASVPVSLTVIAPVLTVSESAYSFGGSDGRAALNADPVTLSLATGQGSYPYTITVTTDDGAQWLSVNPSSGSVGSNGSSASLTVNSSLVRGGNYTGHVHVATTVNGIPLSQDRMVTFNLEANRIVVTASGVGLSNLPGRSVLSRTVQVLSAVGLNTTPWTASSDSSWLSVTPSGVTGGDLVLTASPSGLPLNTTQFANVTIKSSDPAVENQQSIRVGFFGSNTAPVAGSIAIAANRLATSPVEPLVAIGANGPNIAIYNVYTQSLVRTLSSVVATSDGLTYSEDGKSLFIFDTTNYQVVQVDALSGAKLNTYASPVQSFGPAPSAVAVLHPNGWPILFTPAGLAYDLTTGTQIPTLSLVGYAGPALAVSADQSMLADQIGLAARVVRSALGGGTLVVTPAVTSSPAQGADGEACFSASGDRIYTASGYPYNFYATSVATNQLIQTLPGTAYPNSMQCAWNGVVIGGTNAYYDTDDIFIYYGPTGVSLQTVSSSGPTGNRDLAPHGMAVSADATVLISTFSPPAGVYFQPLPAPPP